MTREEREQAIAILENEKKCVNRANKNDYCNRDCYNCELVKTDTEILTALDMAIQALEQSMSIMVYPQVDGITPTVVAHADGERKMRDATPEEQKSVNDYIKSISKPTGINFWDLDNNDDCISRKAVLSLLADHFDNVFDMVKELPSVAIPSDHDGCKDCKYETYPEYYYPCCECKQNYMDEWQKKPHWIHRNDDYTDWLECPNCGYGSEGEVKYGEGTPFCPHCGEKLENEN